MYIKKLQWILFLNNKNKQINSNFKQASLLCIKRLSTRTCEWSQFCLGEALMWIKGKYKVRPNQHKLTRFLVPLDATVHSSARKIRSPAERIHWNMKMSTCLQKQLIPGKKSFIFFFKWNTSVYRNSTYNSQLYVFRGSNFKLHY